MKWYDTGNWKQRYLTCSLAFAAAKGDLEVIELLLQSLSEPIDSSVLNPALLQASENGNVEVVRKLIDLGAEVNDFSWDGETALIKATRIRDLEIVKLLVSNGANVDFVETSCDDSAIRIAVVNKYWEVVEYLLPLVRNATDRRYAKRNLTRIQEESQPKQETSISRKRTKKSKLTEFNSSKNINLEEAIETPSGLRYIDFEVGTGSIPNLGQTVIVNYHSTLENGVKRMTLKRVKLPIGEGFVSQGFDEGVLSMRIGGRRRLIIPPQLACGFYGAVPPNTTLVDDVELLGIEACDT